MARLSPEQFDPILSFRFRIQFSHIQNINFYGKAVTLPVVDNSTQVFDYGNTQIKVKGKTKWNDIDITCYAFEGMTMEHLWSYLNDIHQNVREGTDYYADDYKKDIQIQLMSPSDIVLGTWTLIGAFLSQINYGELDWSAEDIVQPRLTISYDYATYVAQA